MTDVSQETPAPPTRKISVTFERKKDLGNYENVTARAWVEGVIPEQATTAEESAALGNLFLATATAVLDQLDIAYQIDTEMCVVRETVTPATSVQDAEHKINRTMPGTTNNSQPNGIRVMNADEAQGGPLPEWLVTACGAAGITAVWDRRHTATGNQPQFQEAIGRGSQGHGKDGKAKGFWPPK